MAVADYERKLEKHRQNLAFGNELLEIVEDEATLKVMFMYLSNKFCP